jgi:hypothetical protein
MKLRHTTAIAGVALLSSGVADAALLDGISDATNDSSVFISVVERNNINQVVRNLVIDTGARTLATFGDPVLMIAPAPWSTTAAQEAEILTFLNSAASTSTVSFNVGGALVDLSFSTDLRGFISTGNDDGPAVDNFSQLDTAIGNVIQFIGSANNGSFNANGVLASNGVSDPGWHGTQWGNDYGGALLGPTEVLFGGSSTLVGWDMNPSFEIIRAVLGNVTSDAATGDISFGTAVVPVPAAAWLLAPMVAVLAPRLKRRSPA